MTQARSSPTFLDRTVYRHDPERGRVEISALQLLDEALPIVLIGDPGMGKFFLTEALVEADKTSKRVKAGAFVRDAKRYALSEGETCLVIDGLDEVAARAEGDPLHNVLTKLAEIGHPPFILSCRAADWRSAGDSTAIADDYGVLPTQWILAPLDKKEARRFCALEGLEHDATERLLTHVSERGLSELIENPLTLKLLIEVGAASGRDLPQTRRGLYEKAARLICREGDETKSSAPLNALSQESALEAAGIIGAAIILSGAEDIARDRLAISSAGTLELPDLSSLMPLETLQLVLTSRLFKVEQATFDRFAPIHRTVAEYLGARWLSRRLSGHRYSRRRFLSLLSRDGVVPASFRGLHAWLSLDTTFAPDVIEADPYGVLIYGDGDSLDGNSGRLLLQALSKLESEDPHFRGDAWSLRSTNCLVQPHLKEDLRTYLKSPAVQYQFRSLILEALNGSDLSREMSDDLIEIALDTSFSYRERVEAADGLAKAVSDDWDRTSFIVALHKLRDESSTRLTLHCLEEFGLNKFAPNLIADCVLAHTGYLPGRSWKSEGRTGGMLYTMRRDVPIELAPEILDRMCEAVETYSESHRASDEGWDGWYEIRTFTQTLTARVLDNGFDDADRIARWTIEFESHDYGDNSEQATIDNHFRSNAALRLQVQHNLLFGARSKPEGVPLFRLRRYSSGLWPELKDVSAHLTTLNEKAELTSEDRHTWRGLMNIARDEDGFEPSALELAELTASRDPELYRFLHPDPAAEPPQWKKDEEEAERRYAEKRAKEEADELERLQKYREQIEMIRAGTASILITAAEMYHGRYTNVNRKRPHRERLAQWMHEDSSLVDAALEGFDQTISHQQLPSVSKVCESYANGKGYKICLPMLAGLNERLAAGRPLGEISIDTLRTAWCALHVELLDRENDLEVLSREIRRLLYETPKVWSETLRAWFEPQLRVRKENVTALYEFIHREPDADLVAQLCKDWLSRFPDLQAQTEKELIFGVLRVSGQKRVDNHVFLADQAENRLQHSSGLDAARLFLWRSIAFLTAFDRPELWEKDSVQRDFIWEVRRRIGYSNELETESMSLDIDQAAWLVSAFRKAWPVAKHEVYRRGDRSSFDAHQFLNRLINDLANVTSDEASVALSGLIAEPEDGYTSQLKAAIASQQRKRVEAEFEPVSISTLTNSVDNQPPEQHADLQAYVLSAIEALQDKLRGDQVDIIDLFYESKKGNFPKVENLCRDAFLGLLHLEHGIEASSEVAMPGGTRADAGFRLNQMSIPLEAKGQWHKKVWTAAQTQLDEDYTDDYQAAGYGIYLVFWFGDNVPENRTLRPPHRGQHLPASAMEMQTQLEQQIALHRRDAVKVVVLDLERKVRRKR